MAGGERGVLSWHRKPTPMTLDPAKHICAKLPRCKTCGSAQLRATRTMWRDGDAVTRYVTCRKCGGRFLLSLD